MKWYGRFVRWIAHPRLPHEHGYAMAFWAVFLGTVVVPLMVLAWDIVMNNTTRTVYVQMAADVSPLFPEFLKMKPISAWGEAQVRVSGR